MRDTDQDWIHYGEFEPYYGVLTHDRFLRENLTAETLDEFWQTGRNEVTHLWDNLTRLFGDFQPRRALDFGCGVGRLTRAMAEIADTAVGLDVSPQMVAEGRLHAPGNLELTTEFPAGPFDWINSFIVFQHIPTDRGYELLEQLLKVAADSCLLSLHFTFFKDGRGLSDHGIDAMRFGTWDGEAIRPLIRTESAHKMMMYDYDLTRIYAMLVSHGFGDIFLEHTDHAGAHGAFIFARR